MEQKKELAADALGARKGGRPRAETLSPKEPRGVARAAAEARSSKQDDGSATGDVCKATHDGVLQIGSTEIPCYVLEDGRRVISLMGTVKAMGMSRSGSRASGVHRLAGFTASKSLEPFIGADLAECIKSPILFTPPRGGRVSFGYPATVLADMCDAVLAARKASALLKQQMHIAEQAEVLVRGFARVGIVALVDEATGYQEERARDELQTILAAYISPALLPWTKRFPDEFYKQLFRLRGWSYRPPQVAKPQLVGFLTNQLVYEQLPPGVLDELQRRNPKMDSGRRSHKHHQYLTDNIGNPHLSNQLAAVTVVMRLSRDWPDFKAKFAKAFGNKPVQLELDAPRDESVAVDEKSVTRDAI